MTVLGWVHDAAGIPESGLAMSWDASPEELIGLAKELGVVACAGMHADYEIRRIGEDRYLMTGNIAAEVTQPCVATLEPVAQRIEERILVEIGREAGEDESPEDVELSLLDDELEHEALAGGRIEAGRIVFETLAAAIDPYPRKDGARFEREDLKTQGDEGQTAGPFAALAKLKQKQQT